MSGDNESSERLIVRLGTRDDDQQIRALMLRNSMPGSISVSFSTEPSFFDAIDVEGYDPRVIVGDRNGRIVGAGLAASRSVYLNGIPKQVGYLGCLRVDSDARNSTGLARGFRFLKELHQCNPDTPRINLTTILEDNTLARSILTSRRAGLPAYYEFCRYHTVVIPLWPRGVPRETNGIELVSGSLVGPDSIIEFLNDVGKKRQFYPRYSSSDITEHHGLLRGLNLDDFIVAREGEDIVGVMASWDQLAFRQNVVTGYSALMNGVKRCTDLLGRILPLPVLPNIGAPIRSSFAACVAVKEDNCRVFELMLRWMLNTLARGGQSFLIAGFAANDPLGVVAKRYAHYTLKSRLYITSWADSRDEVETLDHDLVPYLELGSL